MAIETFSCHRKGIVRPGFSYRTGGQIAIATRLWTTCRWLTWWLGQWRLLLSTVAKVQVKGHELWDDHEIMGMVAARLCLALR